MNADINILVLGDSHAGRHFHARAVAHFNITKILGPSPFSGPTSQGLNLNKPNQSLTHYMKMMEENRELFNNNYYKYFCSLLGEVDCGSSIWYRIKKYSTTVQEEIQYSVNNYKKFLTEYVTQFINPSKIVVIAVTPAFIVDNSILPTRIKREAAIDIPLEERISCTTQYNLALKEMSKHNGFKFIDITKNVTDSNGYLRPEFIPTDKIDIHALNFYSYYIHEILKL